MVESCPKSRLFVCPAFWSARPALLLLYLWSFCVVDFCLARPTFWRFSSGSAVRILSRKLSAFQVVSMDVITMGWYLVVFLVSSTEASA